MKWKSSLQRLDKFSFFCCCLFVFYLFYFWLHWVFVAAPGVSVVAASQSYSSLRYTGFPLWCLLYCRAQALGAWASVVVAHGLSSCGSWALDHRLSSCGARAQSLCGMWDLPRSGLEPMPPALAGGFLTTAPPGKPQVHLFEKEQHILFFPLLKTQVNMFNYESYFLFHARQNNDFQFYWLVRIMQVNFQPRYLFCDPSSKLSFPICSRNAN